jgi:hypothetical protein
MTVVESVNSKSGIVELDAANVAAVPTSELGQPNGVATLNGSGTLTSAQLPSSVVSSSLAEPGEEEGSYAPNLSEGNVFKVTIKGNITIKPPSGTVPRQEYRVPLRLIQNATGGHTITFSGIEPVSEAPELSTAANAVNEVELVTFNGGITWNYVGMQKGAAGTPGAEGPEGFYPPKLDLPEKVAFYTNPASATTEERNAIAASESRGGFGAQYLKLKSGVPVVVRINVKKGEVIHGGMFYVHALEGTPANRTHLHLTLYSATLKKLRLSADYTSSSFCPLKALAYNGFVFTESYEVTANGRLYLVLTEVMSSGEGIEMLQRESEVASLFAPPTICATGPSGQTTPAAMPETLTLTETGKEPWMAFSS